MVQTIIIARTDKIGDFVVSIPSYATAHAMYPQAKIVALVSKFNRIIAENVTCIDECVCIDDYEDMNELGEKLHSYHPDVFVALVSNNIISKLAVKSKAPVRVGPRSKFWSFFHYNYGIRQRRSQCIKSEAAYNLDLIKQLNPALFDKIGIRFERIRYKSEDAQVVDYFLEKTGLKAQQFVLVNPFTGGSGANLSVTQYGEVINDIISGAQDHVEVQQKTTKSRNSWVDLFSGKTKKQENIVTTDESEESTVVYSNEQKESESQTQELPPKARSSAYSYSSSASYRLADSEADSANTAATPQTSASTQGVSTATTNVASAHSTPSLPPDHDPAAHAESTEQVEQAKQTKHIKPDDQADTTATTAEENLDSSDSLDYNETSTSALMAREWAKKQALEHEDSFNSQYATQEMTDEDGSVTVSWSRRDSENDSDDSDSYESSYDRLSQMIHDYAAANTDSENSEETSDSSPAHVVILGMKQHTKQMEEILNKVAPKNLKNVHCFINNRSLLVAAALVDRCKVFLGPSTGITQIAGNYRKPTICFYSTRPSNSHRRWELYGDDDEVAVTFKIENLDEETRELLLLEEDRKQTIVSSVLNELYRD